MQAWGTPAEGICVLKAVSGLYLSKAQVGHTFYCSMYDKVDRG